MAFILAAGMKQSVQAVQSGIQAHKDFNDPAGPQPRYDRFGQVIQPNAAYGLVMKAEKKYQARKGGKQPGEREGSKSPVQQVNMGFTFDMSDWS